MSANLDFPAALLLLLLACGLPPASAAGASAPEASPELERAIEVHDRAVEGSESAVDEAIGRLESLVEDEPDNELARAYLGSAYTIKARDAALWNKRGWVERGVETIDTAVEAAPEDPRVRLVRAINAYNLPQRVGRYELAAEDFAILLDALREEHPAIDSVLERAVYFHAGAFALKEREDGRALELLEKAAAVEGKNELEDQIASMLRLARNRNP